MCFATTILDEFLWLWWGHDSFAEAMCSSCSPFDGLVIQAVLKLPGLTTAQLHLKWVLPGYAAAARNAGSAVLDHRQPQSRLAGLMSASTLLRDHGEIMIAPNGSLVTPIEERVSSSAWMLF